jgi:hypothetical protein
MTDGTDAPVIDNAASVIDHGGLVIDHRREQVREATRQWRRRLEHGVHRITIDVTNAQLDLLQQAR